MEILELQENNCYFKIKDENISPEDLSRDHLVWLLDEIYNCPKLENIKIPDDSITNNIKNPVEREIVIQILMKLSEFKDNVKNIRMEIESKFPEIKVKDEIDEK